MKTILKLTFAAALLVAALPASAQKFGYVNSEELVMSLPEIETVKADLQKLGEQFMLQIEEMQVEFNNKLDEYQKTEATLTESIKALRQEELTNISQRIQQLQEQGQRELSAKEGELMAPLVEKVRSAIESVMRAQSLAGVFEGQALVTVDDTFMTDVTPLVKIFMGIPEK